MKRYSVLATALLVVWVLCCASVSVALEYPKPVGMATFQMKQGWYDGSPAWYICTATNNIGFAMNYNLTLAPLLDSANAAGAPNLYWVTNFNNSGPVFSSAPPLATYSGLWDVQFVTWLPGVTPWVITNTSAPVGAPPGLPNALQATTVDSTIIVDYPIMALGPLGGPWLPAPSGRYRIGMGRVAFGYTSTKLISLPTFQAFCQDQITRRVSMDRVIITDAENATLAAGLGGANVAPALTDIDEDNIQDFWFIEGGPYMCQKPVLEFCPTSLSWRNKDFDYSPIMEFERLSRDSALPPWTVINNPGLVEALGDAGLLDDVSEEIINANVVP